MATDEEEEVKGFMMARRALVCSYLTMLQSFREKVTLQKKRWAEGLSIYKAMALSLFQEYLDKTMHSLFLSGDNLDQAVIGHSKWARENGLPTVQMLSITFMDHNISVPVPFETFLAAGEIFLSFQTTLGNSSKEESKKEMKEEKVDWVAAFFPGMSSTLGESHAPSVKKDLQKQQRLNAVLDNKDLMPQQKQFMMENIINKEEEEGSGMHLNLGKEEEDEDPLSKRFQLHLNESDHELYSTPLPYSGQYHSLSDIQLPKFYGHPLEFINFMLCLHVWLTGTQKSQ